MAKSSGYARDYRISRRAGSPERAAQVRAERSLDRARILRNSADSLAFGNSRMTARERASAAAAAQDNIRRAERLERRAARIMRRWG